MFQWLRRIGESLGIKRGPWTVSSGGLLDGLLGGAETTSGQIVTEEKALSLSAVFAAVSTLSSTIGALPLGVFRRQAGGGKEAAWTHPAYRLLSVQPNPDMTAISCRQLLEFHRVIWGNAYAEIEWKGNGNPKAFWPIEPWRVAPSRDQAGRLCYRVDTTKIVAGADMLHIPHVSFDGIVGRGVVYFAMESLGLSLSAQEFAARFFGSGARPGGILEHPGNPAEPARRELRESWQRDHGGPRSSHRVGVLWGGWKFNREAGSVAPEEAQLLETRRFGIEEVARWINVPPHILRDLTRSTNNNIEQQGIEFVVYSLHPRLVAYEQEYDRKLLDPPNLYSRHNVTGLLRGDSQARSNYYRGLFNLGALSPNEIREYEDLNPIPGGDKRFVPVNMQTLEQAGQAPPPPAAPGDTQEDPLDPTTEPAVDTDGQAQEKP